MQKKLPDVSLPHLTDEEKAQMVAQFLEGNTSIAELSNISRKEQEEIYSRGYQAWNEADMRTATYCFAFLTQINHLEHRFIFALACALKVQEQYQHAVNLFNHALQMESEYPFTYWHSAYCLEKLGEIDAARDALNSTIELCYAQNNNNPQYSELRQKAESMLQTFNI
ncbi:SycD/LcrH family type III secretion system chaperone [Pantoea cypripedii]|uniref:CesD/SycD/LcrH family type III secretion system chaperone n=1 Tax=Pantoea cypripedii TaxID=55209 RepID=A0A6B9GG23_PANCY|nr:SycD/LcrH family type III secretion system chaperone [Pantoea cypripedii]QGY32136.1 CesD/SycD/LcrH family type III secretion system chaperone [Pantoea cypripedii]